MKTELNHSNESEQSVIGALMMDNDALDRIPELSKDHFYRHEHQIIFSEICKQISAGKRADVVTVGTALREQIQDSIAYLHGIEINTPSSAGIVRYASIVTDKAIKRSLAAICSEGMEIATRHEESAVLVDLVASRIEMLSHSQVQQEPQQLGDLLFDYMGVMQKRESGEIKLIKTGFIDLDKKLGGGLERGTLTIIAGRPGMGKTALGMAVARNVAEWGCSLFFSMEMSNTQVIDRNISSIGRIPISFLRDPNNPDFNGTENWDKLTHAIVKSNELKFFIDDQAGLNTLQIRAKSRKIKRLHGIDVIIIDQLSFITGATSDKSWEAIGEYTRALIQLAKELNVPVILLCQLNRECDKRQDKRPV